jgi:wyosine [tRNA(Phe)-imidazoG37] synthetase (radical SAM superfamily)
LDDVKLILISNATLFHRPQVQEALAVLDTCNGEIWAKLEAGTETYYRAIDRSSIPFQRVLDNILQAARVRSLVIQALFLQLNGEPPSQEEREAYCDRLNEIRMAGGRIKLVQVYTVARTPAEPNVSPLRAVEVEELAALVQKRTGLLVESFS